MDDIKVIPGFESYGCDKEGSIYSLPREIIKKNGWKKDFVWKVKLKKLRACKTKLGYLQVGLRKNGKGYSQLVHRLIGMTFLNLQPNQEINHKDGNKNNNKLDNIEISSRSENIKHAFRIGLRSNKGKNHPIYIDDTIKNQVMEFLKSGCLQKCIKHKLKIGLSSIGEIAKQL